jgi:hypothetical protein
MSIATKLELVKNTKERIRLAINDIGVPCDQNVDFDVYPDKIKLAKVGQPVLPYPAKTLKSFNVPVYNWAASGAWNFQGYDYLTGVGSGVETTDILRIGINTQNTDVMDTNGNPAWWLSIMAITTQGKDSNNLGTNVRQLYFGSTSSYGADGGVLPLYPLHYTPDDGSGTIDAVIGLKYAYISTRYSISHARVYTRDRYDNWTPLVLKAGVRYTITMEGIVVAERRMTNGSYDAVDTVRSFAFTLNELAITCYNLGLQNGNFNVHMCSYGRNGSRGNSPSYASLVRQIFVPSQMFNWDAVHADYYTVSDTCFTPSIDFTSANPKPDGYIASINLDDEIHSAVPQ